MAPISERVLKSQYPLTFDYFSQFRDLLDDRSIHKRWGKGNPFYAMYDIGPYTFAPWKVVWKRPTKGFAAAVVSRLPVIDDYETVAMANDDVMICGAFAEPSDGLEPSTPSL